MFSWSASGHNSNDRYDAWTAALSATHLPWRMDGPPEAFSEAEVQSLDAGPVTLVNCRCDPCAGVRDARMVRGGNDGLYGVLAVRKGRERVRQGDIACDLQPGELLIWDTARPINFEVLDDLEKCTLFICKDQLTRIAGTSRLPIGRLESGRGFGALLFNRLQCVSELIEDFDTVGSEQLGVALTRDLLNAVGSPRAREITSTRQALRERIMRVIEARFQDHTFKTESLAAEVGVSVRTLNKVFEDQDDTIAGTIRRRRLRAVKSDLEKPTLMHCSISQICFARGFSSPEHFSRSFRAEYGMSPRDYRRGHVAG